MAYIGKSIESGTFSVLDTSGNTLYVPKNEANTDYQNILQWVADGNTIQEAD